MSRLYVGRLPRDVRERDIERLFKGYGQIRDICLLSGFGFVEFRERRDAEDVMHDFNNREFMGERLLIEPARVDRRRERGFGGHDDAPGYGGGGPGRRDDRGDRGDDRGRRMGPASAPQRTPYRMLVDNLSSSVSWQSYVLVVNEGCV
ncbi:Serine/arginine-rich splicing factor 6 [Coemansia sp. S142-1]|nr:Serine/arginine-rich splicing factor 6 [Coemansia sp. S142-1]